MACLYVEKLQSFCVRLRRRSRLGKPKRRPIQISDPFDFVHISNLPNGYNEDEINVLKEKAAASRLIPIEDRQPPPSPLTAAASPMISSTSYFSNSTSTPLMPKSRAGYRGLAASTRTGSAGGGGSVSGGFYTSESRPSIAHSLATAEEVAATALSPTSSVTTASSRSGYAKRGSTI